MAQRSSAARARPLFLFWGADSLRARLRAHDLARSLVRDANPEDDLALVPRDALAAAPLGITRYSAKDTSPSDLLMATASEGLFAKPHERRVLLVEDADGLADGVVLGSIPADAAVVLLANGAAGSLAKIVRELGGSVEELAALDPSGVEDWVRRRAKVLGVALEPAAIAALAEAVGADLERADRELEKLRAYALGARVSAVDVRALVAGAVEQDVFELTKAVVRRDARSAVAVLERLLDSGEPFLRLHGLLVWQFRLLLVAAGVRNDRDLERAIAQTGLSRGAVQRWRREAAGVRPSAIARAYESLYAAELAMKTSVDARAVFQLLVLDLCGVTGADLAELAERPPG